MEIDGQRQQQQREEDDPFLVFIEYARSILSPDEDGEEEEQDGQTLNGPGWSWIASRILKTCIAYSSGVTAAILLSDLSQAWNEQHKTLVSKRRPDFISQLKRKHWRRKLPNTVTIDSIYEKNYLSLTSVLEVVIVDAFVLPGTNIYMLTLGDIWSTNTIDLFLHRRYYDLVSQTDGTLKKGRELLLTGCYLRTARESTGTPRLLPTEYLVILLDEAIEADNLLLGAWFSSDSFSSISVEQNGTYLCARVASVGSLEDHDSSGTLKRKQVSLIDADGVRAEFLLWNEQSILADLFSLLAFSNPYIAASAESGVDTSAGFFLEYGSSTQLYLMSSIEQGEQVCISLSQSRSQGSGLTAVDPTEGPGYSQVILHCDSQGSINLSNFPFRSFVVDLREKMSAISLYGVVTDLCCEKHKEESVFSMKVKDTTGTILAMLHFSRQWSLGRVSVGHVVYVSGLTCRTTNRKCLELVWFEKDAGASLINLSSLPALLNSSCLHKLSCLSELSFTNGSLHVCKAWIDQVYHCHVSTRFAHAICGHFVEELPSGETKCRFCKCVCKELVRSFLLQITLADDTAVVFAWCTGQTATELLQIAPEEFYQLPEDEQFIYPSSLEHEKFMVTLVNCRRENCRSANVLLPEGDVSWEITRAVKCGNLRQDQRSNLRLPSSALTPRPSHVATERRGSRSKVTR